MEGLQTDRLDDVRKRIKQAQLLHFTADELQNMNDALRQAEIKKLFETQVSKALEACDMEALGKLIREGKEQGMDEEMLTKVQQTYDEAMPRFLARKRLAEVVKQAGHQTQDSASNQSMDPAVQQRAQEDIQ